MKISFEKYFLKQQSPGLSQQHQEILGQQSNQAESQMANNQLQQSHHPITPQQPNPQIYSNVIPFTGHSGKFNQKRNHIFLFKFISFLFSRLSHPNGWG